MFLLSTDWHLDENPANDYRWQVFDHIANAIKRHKVDVVFILGDLCDRKDRFSAAFINRLFGAFYTLSRKAYTIVLRGNHDTTLHPPHYFDFLSAENPPMDNFLYVTQPAAWCGLMLEDPAKSQGELILLPFTAAPKQDWQSLNLARYKAAFMHATVTGAQVENGTTMTNPDFPILPREVKFYSGDIHVPQQVRNITYVGAPHAIKFGDKYPCRMLLLDPVTYDVTQEIRLDPLRKLMLELASLDHLQTLRVRPGDQVKIRFKCRNVEDWGANEMRLKQWASAKGITIAGTEIIVGIVPPGSLDSGETPDTLLRAFAAQEGLSDELLQTGLQLLREVQ